MPSNQSHVIACVAASCFLFALIVFNANVEWRTLEAHSMTNQVYGHFFHTEDQKITKSYLQNEEILVEMANQRLEQNDSPKTPSESTTTATPPTTLSPTAISATTNLPNAPATQNHGKYSTPRPNTIAIVSYVGSKSKYVKQARHMLWSSWNHTTKTAPLATRSRVDLLLFGDDNLLQNIPPGCTLVDINEPNLVAKIHFSNVDRCYIFNHTYSPTDYWHKNKFMFSLVFIADPAYRELFTSYSDMLRTDTDVAITPQFMKFKPDQFVVGRGGYMVKDFTKARMAQIASDLNMTYQKIHNVGSTWFGNATLSVLMVDRLIEVARWILEHPVYGVEMSFPIWHIGVLSMYSAELVVNDFIPNKKLWLNHLTMDINAVESKRTDYVHHIHCWPDNYTHHFDKLAFDRGDYTREKYPRDTLDTMIVKDYMLAMAVYGY